ncbi:MAG: phosphoribosylanthranilate isomerase [Candidatus Omnitrophica bacterium]|nr:phosphoribosylanthranilate isomerase [Candidatus Omnitrophota bacterium]MDD5592353.1 phosphoribosylanthranilate isomerase [Candidatus Omnitrophota bacterium]
MVKVKICGITNLEDALKIAGLKPDALGFVFYQKSPRYIRPDKAREIIRHIPKSIKKVGVFVDEKENNIKRIAKDLKLDMLQFHGDESPEFCAKFKGYKIIKAFRIKDRVDFRGILRYRTYAYLFDTFVKSKIGGTGKRFNWELIRHLSGFHKPIFLSGGLNAQNAKEAIQQAHPDWVDVSSCVEIKPGEKDYKKAKSFIKAVREKS